MNRLIRSREGRVISALAMCMILLALVFFGVRESQLIEHGQYYRTFFDWMLLAIWALVLVRGAWALIQDIIDTHRGVR